MVNQLKVFHCYSYTYELFMKCHFMENFMEKLTFHVQFMVNQASSDILDSLVVVIPKQATLFHCIHVHI